MLRVFGMPKLLMVLIGLSGLSLIFSVTHVLGLIICVIAWALYVPLPGSRQSFMLRIVMALLATTSFQLLLAMAFWLIKLPVETVVVVLVELLIISVVAVRQDRQAIVGRFMTKDDGISIATAVMSVAIIALFSLHGAPLLNQLLRYVTTGYDNTQHVSLTVSLYDNRGHIYGDFNDLKDKAIYSNMASYPQGWSMSTSIWWRAISQNLDVRANPTPVLFLYFAFTLLWYGLLMFLITRLLLLISESVLSRQVSGTGKLLAMAFVVFLELLFGVGLLVFGFASFYPALVAMLGIVLLSVLLLQSKKQPIDVGLFLVTGLLLGACVGFSWLLALPIAYLAVLLIFIYATGNKVLLALKWLAQNKKDTALAVVIICIASLQGYVQLKYGVDDLVNVPGGITPLNNYVLIGLAVGIIGLIMRDRASSVYGPLVSSTLAGAMLIPGAVYAYQYITAGQATYFSVKASYLPLLLLSVFGGVALLVLFEQCIARKLSWLTATVLIAGSVLFVPIVVGLELGKTAMNGTGPLPYVLGSRYLSPEAAADVADLIVNKHAVDGNIFVYRQLDFSEDIQATHFTQMLVRREIEPCHTLIDNGLVIGWSINPESLVSCANGKDFYLIASGKNYFTLLSQYQSYPNIHVINSERIR